MVLTGSVRYSAYAHSGEVCGKYRAIHPQLKQSKTYSAGLRFCYSYLETLKCATFKDYSIDWFRD